VRYSRLSMHACLLLVMLLSPSQVRAQRSLAPSSPSGQTATPVFEGWYRNPDGTFSLSFGYFNRNGSERLEIPVGDSNFVSPGNRNQGQPTHFAPDRHWGVFAVVVPADFGTRKVVWSLTVRGTTVAVPGSLAADWEIDALQGEASSDNTPPLVRIGATGAEARGPLGATTGPLTVAAGKPLSLSVMATDDGKSKSAVDLTWFKHQGPGDVSFATPTHRLSPTGGSATTAATFSRPGEYLVRVRANDLSPMTAGHAQCCWTNAFVKVTVTP